MTIARVRVWITSLTSCGRRLRASGGIDCIVIQLPYKSPNRFVMNYLTYTIQIQPRSCGYIARVPALPGCTAFASTFEQCLVVAHELIDQRLSQLVLHGQPIPIEAEHPRDLAITV